MGTKTVYKTRRLYRIKKEISGIRESLEAFIISIEKKRKKALKRS